MIGDWPDVPILQALGDGGLRPTTQLIVIHTTESNADAAGEAQYAAVRRDETSAHYYCDRGGRIWQAVRDTHVAFSALWEGNHRGLHVELCGHADSADLTEPLLRCGARIVARLAQKFAVPVRKVDYTQIRAGARGICGHLDVTRAFPQDGGTHWDPGYRFPWTTFLDLVRAEGDDMPLSDSEKQLLLNGAQAAANLQYVLGQGRGPADWWIKLQLAAILAACKDDDTDQILAAIDAAHRETVADVVAALTPLIESDGPVSREDLEAALRTVLGSVDEQPA
jgi:hypothetical protein